MPHWTSEQLRSTKAGHDYVTPTRKPRPIIQKQQAPDEGTPHNQPQATEVDERSYGQFHVAITLFVSDERERDGDGAESTLLDCLIAARKRLLSLPDRVLLEVLQVSKRTGGRPPHH